MYRRLVSTDWTSTDLNAELHNTEDFSFLRWGFSWSVAP
jgi:hypothetical protein